MFKNSLSNWNVKRLRLLLLVFFFALAIPTAILIKQAYSQLKWESFHHQRQLAEELANRIDQNYKELIEKESARTFTDYSYLNIAGDNRTQRLQRSPLSRLPVNSEIPGVIGYFQIDNQGKFTTPLLPDMSLAQLPLTGRFHLGKTEKQKRLNIHNQIFQVLNQNKLIAKTIRSATAKTEKDSTHNVPARLASKAGSSVKPEVLAEAPSSASPEPTIPAQEAFDRLQSPSEKPATSSKKKYPSSKGRVEDLKLQKAYQAKAKKKKLAEVEEKSKQRVLSRRKESNRLPSYSGKRNRSGKRSTALQVKIFESEIDKFEFSILQSGHFVMYRKVWRNGLRYIQGLLIKPDTFINAVIRKSFYNASVSAASNLTVAYQGNILSTLKSKPGKAGFSRSSNAVSIPELENTLLLQDRLSATLGQIELIFSINKLPAGPGAIVISWLSVILLLVLCSGFLILYFLGVKQIRLARQQQDFVSAVSHELKTPLTSIRMYGEMLREGWTTEDKRKQYYDYIYDESERLTRLINNVLQLARMTRNELPVDLKPVSLNELTDIIHSKISSHVNRANFTLNIDCDESIKDRQLNADTDYFIQVIINIVDNAIKFSAKADRKQVDIKCKAVGNDKVVISVRDYGPGIKKDQLRKIFNLFYRSENELTRETVGTGIGLSLVKQLVKSMHGKIDAVNKEPGVEFQISFELL